MWVQIKKGMIMSEYIVGLIISEKHRITAQMIVNANGKKQAIKKAEQLCEEEQIITYGVAFCDYTGW